MHVRSDQKQATVNESSASINCTTTTTGSRGIVHGSMMSIKNESIDINGSMTRGNRSMRTHESVGINRSMRTIGSFNANGSFNLNGGFTGPGGPSPISSRSFMCSLATASEGTCPSAAQMYEIYDLDRRIADM
eukprot:285588-Rhodomonas_salina.2